MFTFYFLGIKQPGHEAQYSPPSCVMLKCMDLYLHPSPYVLVAWTTDNFLLYLIVLLHIYFVCLCMCVCMCVPACECNCGSACARYQNQAAKHYTTTDKDIKLSKFWITIMYLVSRNDQYTVPAAVCKDAELQLSYILTILQNNSWILLYNNFATSNRKNIKMKCPLVCFRYYNIVCKRHSKHV